MLRLSLAAASLLALTCAGLPATAAPVNLVTNGDFSTGDFTGWTQLGTPPPGFFFTKVQNGLAWLGAVDTNSYLFQDIPTVVGRRYSFSFDLALGNEPGPRNFDAYADLFGGGPALLSLGNDTAPFPFEHFVFTFIANDVDSVIGFKARMDSDYWYLDNVSVTANSPLPPALVLFASGLVGLGFAVWQRRKGIGAAV
jgi:hypothetical protein